LAFADAGEDFIFITLTFPWKSNWPLFPIIF